MSEIKYIENNDSLNSKIGFIVEIDKIKNIIRQNYICDASRRENDAEHSWHIATMAFLLSEYAPEGTDIMRVMQMALIHDLVEIDAGDTYAYDPEAVKSQAEREQKAAERIFGLLPSEDTELFMGLWQEFEECKTNEAIYCRAMDVLQPVLMNYTSNGKSWMEHEVHEEQVEKRIARIRNCSEELYQVSRNILDSAVESGKIISKNK